MERRRILRYLPENYQLAAVDEHGVLSACIAVMEAMHGPIDRILRSLDRYFDPYRAVDQFVMLQATWLGLDRYFEWTRISVGRLDASFPTGTDRLRLLIAEFPSLVQTRGTREALTRFLEVATGIRGFDIADGNDPEKSFHFVVTAPEAARRLAAFVEKIVAEERPAHATYEIQYADASPAAAFAETRAAGRTNPEPRPKRASSTKRPHARRTNKPRKNRRKE